MAAFARSAAAILLKETLPEFIPGFDKEIDYFVKECDFEDGNERKYFDKYICAPNWVPQIFVTAEIWLQLLHSLLKRLKFQ